MKHEVVKWAKVVKDAGVRLDWNEAAVPASMSPGEFADFVGKEIQHWRKIARDANIQPE